MAKVGRPRMFDSPQELWDAFCEYRRDTKSNPILVHDFVGKDGEEVFRQRERPLTYEGFKSWMFEKQSDLGFDSTRYFDGRMPEFVSISTHIKEIIRQDQVSGGMAGIYNASLTARVNGLVDKTENKQMIEQPLFSMEDTKQIEGSVKKLSEPEE